MATVEITGENFKGTIEKEGIVLLDFWAEWCGPCKAFAPVFEKASETHADVTFGKIDTEAQQELAGAAGIRRRHVRALLMACNRCTFHCACAMLAPRRAATSCNQGGIP